LFVAFPQPFPQYLHGIAAVSAGFAEERKRLSALRAKPAGSPYGVHNARR
jgi:hypothetical protein